MVVSIFWDDSYAVNVADMDNQHKRLFELIAELHTAMRSGKGRQMLDETFAGLIAYTQTHFKDEEELMRLNDYPGLAAHQKMHAALIEKVEDYQRRFMSGELAITIEVMEFLKDWLVNHIQKTDMQYGRFLNQKGIK